MACMGGIKISESDWEQQGSPASLVYLVVQSGITRAPLIQVLMCLSNVGVTMWD
ncbi:HLH DNA binding domain protein [Aspergillus luchuensis]|uniref:HLH DNA binding domain protein n=1 Tax=Aspergillus kawachii TaxID=1069201 RepID=A0A146F9E5_ASPKA|nr:HLH DNA binding domain protein [Aspergillus luchuensis]